MHCGDGPSAGSYRVRRLLNTKELEAKVVGGTESAGVAAATDVTAFSRASCRLARRAAAAARNRQSYGGGTEEIALAQLQK